MDQLDFDLNRRRFLEFLGVTGATAALPFGSALASPTRPFAVLNASTADTFAVANGFTFDLLISFGDIINAAGDKFGYDNDFTACLPLNTGEALLWVNHETVNPLFFSGIPATGKRHRAQIDEERQGLGGSILKIKRTQGDRWEFVPNDPLNRRITGTTVIPFSNGATIAGSKAAVGMVGNCSGGQTPWHTILSGEENYHYAYGEIDYAALQQGNRIYQHKGDAGWTEFYEQPPEHYGWIVEIDPKTGKAQKLVAMGRFAHEGATVAQAADGRAVAYMGDDANNECIYKFIADKPGALDTGALYVADTVAGRWLLLDRDKDKHLEAEFKTQTDLLTWTRRAAAIVGGTKLDRPEGIAIHPTTKAVFVSLTNNSAKNVPFGSLLKIEETNGDHLSMTFKASTFLAGGDKTGFACPDNICFDRHGNLWMTTDMSEKVMHAGQFKNFGNNSLFVIPTAGPHAGKAMRVANAPVDAELTGPSLSPDGRTLFLSVQHPGGGSKSLKELTSHWPDGGQSVPKPAVVAIRGKILDGLA